MGNCIFFCVPFVAYVQPLENHNKEDFSEVWENYVALVHARRDRLKEYEKLKQQELNKKESQ
jgi:hypothetical protein